MSRTTIALMLALAPSLVAAQTQQVPPGFSAATTLRLEATMAAARREGLPTQPLIDRMAEGQAKGATEAQVVAATDLAQAQLTASHQALVQAGRAEPSQAEIARGAQVLASGATTAQLEAFISGTPSDRGLDVALAVVNSLTLQGVGATNALAAIGAQLGRGASDGQLVALTGGLGIGLTRKP
jgi:hypothetical protein